MPHITILLPSLPPPPPGCGRPTFNFNCRDAEFRTLKEAYSAAAMHGGLADGGLYAVAYETFGDGEADWYCKFDGKRWGAWTNNGIAYTPPVVDDEGEQIEEFGDPVAATPLVGIRPLVQEVA